MTKIWEDNPFSQNSKLWQIKFSCFENDIAKWEEFFEGKALSFVSIPDNDIWHIEVIVDEEPNIKQFPNELNIEYSLIEDKDWLNEVAKDIEDVETGLFHIVRNENQTSEKVRIIINNARAFGMGDHTTTIGCIKSLEYLNQNMDIEPRRILDIGTGTGILAIAAKKLWPKSYAFGVDIDKEAVKISTEQALLNKVDIEFDENLDKYEGKKYDLILANILANPLIEMAPKISNMLDKKGFLILSGFTKDQSNKLEEIYGNLSLKLHNSSEESGWMALIFEKN